MPIRRTRRRTRRKRGGSYCSQRYGGDLKKAKKAEGLLDSITEFEEAMKAVTFAEDDPHKPINDEKLLEATKLLDEILKEAHTCKCRDYVRCYINDNIWKKKMGYNLTTRLIKAMINEDGAWYEEEGEEGRRRTTTVAKKRSDGLNEESVNMIFFNQDFLIKHDFSDLWRYLPVLSINKEDEKEDKVELLPLTNKDAYDRRGDRGPYFVAMKPNEEKWQNFNVFKKKVDELNKVHNGFEDPRVLEICKDEFYRKSPFCGEDKGLAAGGNRRTRRRKRGRKRKSKKRKRKNKRTKKRRRRRR